MSSCYNCAKSFSLLNREKGCKNCGFSFCGNCLRHQVQIPKEYNPQGAIMGKVCEACFKSLSSSVAVSGSCPSQDSSSSSRIAPPDALQKRLAALAKVPPSHITVYRENQKMVSLKEGLSTKDMEIANRLGRLKSDRKILMEVPTDEELSDRLAKLKGQNENVAGLQPGGSFSSPLPKEEDKRSDVQRTDDLVKQIQDEVSIDQKMPNNPEDEIAERLARLRGQDYYKQGGSSTSSALDPAKFISDLGPPTIPAAPMEDPDEDPAAFQRLLDEIAENARRDAETCVKDLDLDAMRKNHSKNKSSKLPHHDGGSDAGEDDEDEAEAARILEQVLAEQRLESKSDDPDLEDADEASGQNFRSALKSGQRQVNRQIGRALSQQQQNSKEDDDEEEEELPWCSICNEDATTRCLGCDGDLYCSNCFKECHDQFDLADHRRIPFTAKKTKESSVL